MDLPALAYRRGNYPVLNFTHGKYVDVILSTVVFPAPFVDEIPQSQFQVGTIEARPTCLYLINPNEILVHQPPCSALAFSQCSHIFSYSVYLSTVSEKCIYKYFPCPDFLGKSSPLTGYTRLYAKDHPYLKRTCFNTTAFPLQTC